MGLGESPPTSTFRHDEYVNASTGFSGFQLKTGHSPCVILPLIPWMPDADEVDDVKRALSVLKRLNDDISEARDNLLRAKVSQAEHANRHHQRDCFQQKRHCPTIDLPPLPGLSPKRRSTRG
jgi:hypothetical protein